MGILDGQAVSAAITNPAFINKNLDDSMPNILAFTRALSGSSIADIQAAVNKLYTATGASESQTGTVYSAPSNTISDGDSHETALGKLARKFDPATGHMHTGGAGDAPPISGATIIGVPYEQFVVPAGTLSGVTGSSWNVTSILTGKSPSLNSTTLGVVVNNPYNRSFLANGSTGNLSDVLIDLSGNIVYGRLTSATGSWTLSFYTLISGVETPYSFSTSTDISWYYRELFQPLASTPVYEPNYFEFEFKSVKTVAASGFAPVFGDVVLKAGTGMLISATGNTIEFAASGGGSGTTIAASGSPPLSGAVTLVAGTNVNLSQVGQDITISASGGGTTSPLTTKGDVYGYDTANARIPVGSPGQYLIADSFPALGVRYQDQNPKNYIINNDAEIGAASGWTTYADAAANIPVDGTGGSPNSTWAATGSSPLDGSFSFLWTKSGSANRQGEGVSYPFTIDSADQAKVLSVEFNYIIAASGFTAGNGITAPLNDGTTSTNAGNSDLEVFVYDVTNAVLVPVSPEVLISNSVTIPSTFKGIFQTNYNSTSYRFILHTATTSTSNYAVKFDRFYVGPQTIVQGPAVGDWTSYTPIFAGLGSGRTDTVLSGFYRRVGDSIEVDALWIGTTGSGTGDVTVTIPSFVTIDSTVFGNNSGQNFALDGYMAVDTANFGAAVPIIYAGSNTFVGRNPGTAGNISGNSATKVRFYCKVKVSGWSSNNLQSNDAATRVVAARYTLASANSFTNGVETLIDYPTKVFDTHGAVTTGGSWRFIAPVSGPYRVSAAFAINDSTSWLATNVAYLRLRKNGTGYANLFYWNAEATSTTALGLSGSTTVSLKSGEYIDCTLFQGSSALAANIADSNYNYIDIALIQGPANITSVEVVNASYRRASGNRQSIANNTLWVSLLPNVKDDDSHGAFNTSTGEFTVPIAGRYRITASVAMVGLTANTGQILLSAAKNGTGIDGPIGSASIAASTEEGTTYTYVIPCLAGDILLARTFQNNGSSRDSVSGVCFTRVGD